MTDPRMQSTAETANPKPRKKNVSNPKGSMIQLQGNDARGIQQVQGKKAAKRSSALFQQPERSNSDSLPDSSNSGNEYRALRRKYLLLEEESFSFGTELQEIEVEVQTLEDEKLALLDQLVVLEGLVNPSELPP